jgi:hypothetical protein
MSAGIAVAEKIMVARNKNYWWEIEFKGGHREHYGATSVGVRSNDRLDSQGAPGLGGRRGNGGDPEHSKSKT